MECGGDVEVSRGSRCARQWKAPPPLRPSCGGTRLFRLLHPLPNVPDALHVLNVPTNARRAALRPYSKGSDRAGGIQGDWRWGLGCGREHV
jgi:hypothetical protein